MAKPNYVIKVDQKAWNDLHDVNHKDAAAIDRSRKDSKIHENASTLTIEIDDCSYGDFNNVHRAYKNAMTLAASGASMWMSAYGTDAFRKEEEGRIEASREELRKVVPPDENPNDKLALPDDCDAHSGTKSILEKSPGVCLGHGHSQSSAYQYLADMVEDQSAFGSKGGMLFIEELPAYLQPEIDTYMSTDPEPPWSADAQTFFTSTNTARGLKGATAIDAILKKAREKQIKVFAIDSGECSPSMAPPSSFGEQRTANMNTFAKSVMDKAIKDNPGRTFVAFVGGKHANTHEGGIPGLSQIYNIPAVNLSDNGTIERDDEDTSLRGMPEKEVQLFVDNFLIAYNEEKRANRIPGTELPDSGDQKTMAVDLANRLKAAGKLPDPTGKSSDTLRQQVKDLVATIPKGQAQRYEAAKASLKAGKTSELLDMLTLDPNVTMLRDGDGKTKGQNLLQLATNLGAKQSADILRTTMSTTADQMIAGGKKLDPNNLAEIIVIKAEDSAWDGGTGNGNGQVDVNPKKHKEMVAQLTKTFEQEEVKSKQAKTPSKLANPGQLVATLTSSLSEDGGFYKKTKKKIFGKRDPDHVSIDKKMAAKIWVRELANL